MVGRGKVPLNKIYNIPNKHFEMSGESEQIHFYRLFNFPLFNNDEIDMKLMLVENNCSMLNFTYSI